MSNRGLQRRRTNAEWRDWSPIIEGPQRSFVASERLICASDVDEAFRRGREAYHLGDKRNPYHSNDTREGFVRGYRFQQRYSREVA